MHSTWILCANSAVATVYAADSPTAPLVEMLAVENPEARLRDTDLTSDRPGRTFDSMGSARHAKSSEVGPKEQEEIRFAREVVDLLEQKRVEHAFDRLIVVAAPRFLGLVRSSMAAPLKSAVTLEMSKDYVALKPEELRSHLPEQI